jgi:DNA polymerase III epsilon subunit-like protein
MKVLVFDTETNGLPEGFNPSIFKTNLWPYLLQLSCILYDIENDELLAQEDWIIKVADEVPISKEITAINGITKLQCKRLGEPIGDVLKEFNKLITRADKILAHNISFDKRVIMVESIRNKQSCNLSQRSEFYRPEFCTMKAGKSICQIEKLDKYGKIYYKYPKLSELHVALFGQTPNNTHDATVDILICLRCFCQMKFNFDIYTKNAKIKKIVQEYEI